MSKQLVVVDLADTTLYGDTRVELDLYPDGTVGGGTVWHEGKNIGVFAATRTTLSICPYGWNTPVCEGSLLVDGIREAIYRHRNGSGGDSTGMVATPLAASTAGHEPERKTERQC